MITTTHIVIGKPLQIGMKKIPLTEIKKTKISEDNNYEKTSTILIFLNNKQQIQFASIKNAQKVNSIIKETINKIKSNETSNP